MSTFTRTWGTVDAYVQDQTTDRISLYLAQVLDTITIQVNTEKNDELITIETTGTVPVVGNFICLQEDGKITQVEITSVSLFVGDVYDVGIAIPLDYAYTTEGGCTLQNVNMNVDGSTTPIEFEVTPKAPYTWDITRMIISMIMGSGGDDGEFGDIVDGIDKGVYFRKDDFDTSQNLANIKTNGDLRLEGYDLTYIERSGGLGSYGLASRITFSGQDKSGVVIRLCGNSFDRFEAVVRDDLTSIGSFRVKVQGHVVE